MRRPAPNCARKHIYKFGSNILAHVGEALVLGNHFLAVLFIFAALSTNAFAADYYVATTGNDTTGNGSLGNPWRTIQYAIRNVTNGSTIHVAAGTYSENVNVNKSVNLIGNSSQNTNVVAAITEDHALEVKADNVNISNFRISGATGECGLY